MSSALSSAEYFKSHCCKQCGPRSDCSSRSSLIWVHTICLYAKSMFEKFARRCSRRHKQMTFSDAGFLGALWVNVCSYIVLLFYSEYCRFFWLLLCMSVSIFFLAKYLVISFSVSGRYVRRLQKSALSFGYWTIQLLMFIYYYARLFKFCNFWHFHKCLYYGILSIYRNKLMYIYICFRINVSKYFYKLELVIEAKVYSHILVCQHSFLWIV